MCIVKALEVVLNTVPLPEYVVLNVVTSVVNVVSNVVNVGKVVEKITRYSVNLGVKSTLNCKYVYKQQGINTGLEEYVVKTSALCTQKGDWGKLANTVNLGLSYSFGAEFGSLLYSTEVLVALPL